MDGDLTPLDELAARLEDLDKVGGKIATNARPGVERVARATAAAGTTPDGETWAPRKKGGGKPLADAASAITVVVSGTTRAVLTLVLSGVYVYHHRSKTKSKTKGLPRRVILPEPGDDLPSGIVSEIQKSAKSVLERLLGGRK